jgi:ketosteroid isomerase-like protein
MGQSNVDFVRAVFDIFNREGGEAAIDFAMAGGTELVWHAAPEWPGRPTYEGREGALELIQEWTGSFEEYRWDIDRLYDLDDDRVLVLAHHRGRTGETRVEGQVGAIWRLEEGRAVEARFFFEWHEAMAAAGVDRTQQHVN